MIFNIFFSLLIATAIWLAIMISRADLRRRIIPDAYLFPLMLIGLILTTFYSFPTDISNAVIGATYNLLGEEYPLFITDEGNNVITFQRNYK